MFILVHVWFLWILSLSPLCTVIFVRKWLSTYHAQYMGISVLSLLGFIWHKSFQVNVFEHSSPAVGIVLGTFLSWGRCETLGMCLEDSGLALLPDFSGFRLDTTYYTTGFQHHRPSFPDSWPIRLSYLKRRFLWMMRKNKSFLPWAVSDMCFVSEI